MIPARGHHRNKYMKQTGTTTSPPTTETDLAFSSSAARSASSFASVWRRSASLTLAAAAALLRRHLALPSTGCRCRRRRRRLSRGGVAAAGLRVVGGSRRRPRRFRLASTGGRLDCVETERREWRDDAGLVSCLSGPSSAGRSTDRRRASPRCRWRGVLIADRDMEVVAKS